ncbi:hypothetical protein CMZ82_10425, partial [Lysobacteraceae bacterium NML93-0792]
LLPRLGADVAPAVGRGYRHARRGDLGAGAGPVARQRPGLQPAAPPAATPEPATPPATADVGFIVQVGAFSNAADANAMRDRLRSAGITAFTDSVQTDKGRLTRVKAGPVTSRGEAEQLKTRVRSAVGIDGLIRAHP